MNRSTILICPEIQLREQFLAGCPATMQGRENLVLDRYPVPEAVDAAVKKTPHRLWVVDASTNLAEALSIVQLALLQGDPIFTLHRKEEATGVLECVRAGVTGFLVEPMGRASVEAAYAKAGDVDPGPPPEDSRSGSELHCFLGVSGSSGTSTSAAAYANLWHRRVKGKMLLADLDPVTGIQAFLWKVKPKYSFADALQRANELDADVWNGLICHAGGMDFLPAPERADIAIEAGDPTGLLSFVRKSYPRIVADGGLVRKPWGLSLAAESDRVFLVARSHAGVLEEITPAMEQLKEAGVSPGKINLILNRWISKRDGGLPELEDCGAAQLLRIPDEPGILHDAVLEGHTAPQNAELTRALSRMLAETQREVPIVAPRKPKSSGGGFLQRMFGKRSK